MDAAVNHKQNHKHWNLYLGNGFISNVPVCPNCRRKGSIVKQIDAVVAGRYILGVPNSLQSKRWIFECASELLYFIREQTHFAVCPFCEGTRKGIVPTEECIECNGKGWVRI